MPRVIGLIDIDSHNFPNLCLMKMSAWFKRQGCDVHLLRPDDVLLGQSLFDKCDKYYGACVFEENAELAMRLANSGIEVGGTGISAYVELFGPAPEEQYKIYNLRKQLPKHIETVFPDYELYGIKDTAYGFLTRGCPRGCGFCIVGKKEGLKSAKVADLSQFWDGQKNIKLLDPNLLAFDQHEKLLKQLIESGAWVDFTQGLDARMLTEKNIDLINHLKVKMIHFAWDNPRDKHVKTTLKKFKELSVIKDHRKTAVYVLCNYWSTHEEDLRRVYWLREHEYDPYIMIYDKAHAPQKTRYLQRWVNNKRIFKSIADFSDYDHRIG